MASEYEEDALSGIMDYCNKHPNSKISILIREVQNKSDQSQRHIVNLLVEISEKSDICVDFNISLQYFLNKFLNIQIEPNLSDAGCIILHATKIYSKRVDYIYEATQAHMNNLCKHDAEIQKEKQPSSPEKLKRKTKRMLKQTMGPYETELVEKEFRIVPVEKRQKTNSESNLPPNAYFTDWLKFKKWQSSKKLKSKDEEDYFHPAMWDISTIGDFDDDQEIDSVRNYRLFTYHIEHRYNTLVHDINFPMYFKVKDFLDDDDGSDVEESAIVSTGSLSKKRWPTLSEDYVNKYIGVENAILQREINSLGYSGEIVPLSKRFRGPYEKSKDSKATEVTVCSNVSDTSMEMINKSNIGQHMIDQSTPNKNGDLVGSENVQIDSIEISIASSQNDLVSDDSISNEQRNTTQNDVLEESEQIDTIEEECIIPDDNFDLKNIRVRLPHFGERRVLYHDLDEIDFRMLNPIVQTTNILSSITDVSDFKITLDSHLKNWLGIDEGFWNIDEPWQSESRKPKQAITLNILGLPKRRLRQKVLFKLPDEDFLLFKNHRIKNASNQAQNNDRSTKTKIVTLNSSFAETFRNAPSPDFLGFAEANMFLIQNDDLFRKISTDSGICDNELLQNSRNGCNNSSEDDEDANNSDLPNHIPTEVDNNSGLSLCRDLSCTINELEQTSGILDRDLLSSTVIERGLNSKVTEDISEISGRTGSDNDITKDNLSQNEDENCDSQTLSQESGFVSGISESQSSQTEECIPMVTNKYQSSFDLDPRQEKEIEDWSVFLAPILVKASDHFDMFDMGTDIINTFSANTDNPASISFADVMEDKNPSHTARYFLSTLLLANQDNLKINVNNYDCNQPCKLTDLKLELTNRTRHTVSLEDDIGKAVPKRKIEKCHASVIENLPVSKPPKFQKHAIPEDADSGFVSCDISSLSNEDE